MKHIDWKLIGKGIGGATIVTALGIILLSGLIGALITNELLQIGVGKTIVTAAVFILLFGASWYVAKKAPSKRLLLAVLTASLILAVILLTKSIIFQGAEFTSGWHIFAAVMVSLPAGMVASSKKGRRR